MQIAVETFIAHGEPSSSSRRVRPLPGQGAYTPTMRVECSKSMRYAFPLGQCFLLDVFLKNKDGGSTFLYSNHRDPWQPIERDAAIAFVARTFGSSVPARPLSRGPSIDSGVLPGVPSGHADGNAGGRLLGTDDIWSLDYGTRQYDSADEVVDAVKTLWAETPRLLPRPHYHRPPVNFLRLEGSWSFTLHSDFCRAVRIIDKNLQARVLEALTAVCSAPLQARGDTVKPLEGDKQGLWRYRIGDHRLIYKPDVKTHQVSFLDFDSRGSVYR